MTPKIIESQSAIHRGRHSHADRPFSTSRIIGVSIRCSSRQTFSRTRSGPRSGTRSGPSQSAVHRGRHSHPGGSASVRRKDRRLNPLFIAADILTQSASTSSKHTADRLNPLFIAADILTHDQSRPADRTLRGLNPLFIAADILTIELTELLAYYRDTVSIRCSSRQTFSHIMIHTFKENIKVSIRSSSRPKFSRCYFKVAIEGYLGLNPLFIAAEILTIPPLPGEKMGEVWVSIRSSSRPKFSPHALRRDNNQ